MLMLTLLWLNVALSCRYVAFDFHKECSRMRWHRLQILVDSVADLQDEFGYDRHRTCISGRCVSTVVRLMIRSVIHLYL